MAGPVNSTMDVDPFLEQERGIAPLLETKRVDNHGRTGRKTRLLFACRREIPSSGMLASRRNGGEGGRARGEWERVLRGSVWCNDDDGDGDGGGGSDGDGGGGEESRPMPTCSYRAASRRERSSDAHRASYECSIHLILKERVRSNAVTLYRQYAKHWYIGKRDGNRVLDLSSISDRYILFSVYTSCWHNQTIFLSVDIVCEGVKVTKTGRRENRLVLDEIADCHRRATIIDIVKTNRPEQSYGTVYLPLPAHAAGPMARHGTVDWSIATQLTKINLSARRESLLVVATRPRILVTENIKRDKFEFPVCRLKVFGETLKERPDDILGPRVGKSAEISSSFFDFYKSRNIDNFEEDKCHRDYRVQSKTTCAIQKKLVKVASVELRHFKHPNFATRSERREKPELLYKDRSDTYSENSNCYRLQSAIKTTCRLCYLTQLAYYEQTSKGYNLSQAVQTNCQWLNSLNFSVGCLMCVKIKLSAEFLVKNIKLKQKFGLLTTRVDVNIHFSLCSFRSNKVLDSSLIIEVVSKEQVVARISGVTDIILHE
ncbi:hypothetical protein EAG_12695 [Camponotus floridanus]|uniref:Uncharacterized protein n=1 Tax=Camponotus floridanus TaxID=104421 RepID=E2AXY8_CAMFO|nr:hypothetical protein EAG_12695 [Camponotus floridanus]